MIVTCPSCETQFNVQPAQLGPRGRRVRCARCGHQWHQAPLDDTGADDDDPFASPAYEDGRGRAAEDEADEDEIAAIAGRLGVEPAADETDADEEAPLRQRGWLGWAALLLILAALGAGAVVLRDAVVQFWPPAARAYQLANLPVTEPAMYGLSIRNVRSERAIDAGQRVLLVSGDVVNNAAQAKKLPRLRVALTDAGGAEIFHWTVTVAKPELGPTETVRFSTRLPNPPEAAKSLAVRFDVN
jgi:predicted Zn finger-like uncharacterized protein